jgi:glutamate racemase
MTRTGVVAVIATERSLQGEKFLSTLARYGQGVEVLKIVGRGFVEAVENNAEQDIATREMVKGVIEPLIGRGVDVIMLGCTHYPFLRGAIEEVVGDRSVLVIDSGAAVEKRVESLLDEYNLRAEPSHQPQMEFISFGDEQYRQRLEHKAMQSL